LLLLLDEKEEKNTVQAVITSLYINPGGKGAPALLLLNLNPNPNSKP
jgi:hypothetical protein